MFFFHSIITGTLDIYYANDLWANWGITTLDLNHLVHWLLKCRCATFPDFHRITKYYVFGGFLGFAEMVELFLKTKLVFDI